MTERVNKRINSSDKPNGNDESGASQLACNQSRRAKDARTDGAANDDSNPKADVENAQQVPF
jgi:hypothetical protein